MKERLTEVLGRYISSPPCDTCKTPIGHCSTCGVDRLVDYLLDNGVTIPVLCKDCKKWLKVEPSGTGCRVCADSTRIMLPYDFCSRGVRRDNNE